MFQDVVVDVLGISGNRLCQVSVDSWSAPVLDLKLGIGIKLQIPRWEQRLCLFDGTELSESKLISHYFSSTEVPTVTLVRTFAAKFSFEAGASVVVAPHDECNLTKFETWRLGWLSAENSDGSFDISFDDGIRENNLHCALIYPASFIVAVQKALQDAKDIETGYVFWEYWPSQADAHGVCNPDGTWKHAPKRAQIFRYPEEPPEDPRYLHFNMGSVQKRSVRRHNKVEPRPVTPVDITALESVGKLFPDLGIENTSRTSRDAAFVQWIELLRRQWQNACERLRALLKKQRQDEVNALNAFARVPVDHLRAKINATQAGAALLKIALRSPDDDSGDYERPDDWVLDVDVEAAETKRAETKEKGLYKCGFDRCRTTPPKERCRTDDKTLQLRVDSQKPSRRVEMFERRIAEQLSSGTQSETGPAAQSAHHVIAKITDWDPRHLPSGVVQVARQQVLMQDTGERFFLPQSINDVDWETSRYDNHDRKVVHRVVSKSRDLQRAAQRDSKYWG